MKTIITFSIAVFLSVNPYLSIAQTTNIEVLDSGGAFVFSEYDANNPEISAEQYEILNQRCAENIKTFGLDKIEKSTLLTNLEWPVRSAVGFTDCSYYLISAYVDQNPAAGAISDYYCGTNTYDTHKGTDFAIWPFSFYKMDNNQVEVIAAASGTIISKDDGNFDRNCVSTSEPANYVIIKHPDNSCALYWHLKSGSVTTKNIGETVSVGEYLGVVGSSGSSSGPHLHFEIWSGTTNDTYNDPFAGDCNDINTNSWWTNQKPHTEPSVLKASVHTTDALMPGCPFTETPNESTSYTIPFQGPELAPGYAKFYVFLRNETIGTPVNWSILNPGGTTYLSGQFNCLHNYNASYYGLSKLLPTTAGTYSFQATYNGMTCSQDFEIITSSGIESNSDIQYFKMYPNPSDGCFSIEMNEDLTRYAQPQIHIYNTIGEKVFQVNLEYPKSEISTNLQSGMYFYKIYNITKPVNSGKIIIR